MQVGAMLVYVADPMCSWCYGFGPELAALHERFAALPLRLVMGGLRAFSTQPMPPATKATIRAHWQQVAGHSGQPFDAGAHTAFAQDGFIYDTEPACRAVVCARELAAQSGARDLSWPLMRAVQHAFYAEGRDITRSEELAACYATAQQAAPDGPAPAEFAAALDGAAMQAAVRADFETVQRWGIQGFPALLAAQGARAQLVASGYMKADALAANLQRTLDQPT